MSDLNLTGQTTIKNAVAPKLVQLKSALELRRPVWDKLTFKKKKRWILSDKDPIISIAWDIYKYLYSYFEGQEPNGN